MDILYVLECIAYLVVIPMGIVMTRLFHLETQRFITIKRLSVDLERTRDTYRESDLDGIEKAARSVEKLQTYYKS